MSMNWVMLNRDGEVVKLPGEKIYYKVRSRITLDLSTPKILPNAPAFSVKSDSGIVYITNSRVIYLPSRTTEAFKSFSAPILDFDDTRVASSFFGPWSWTGLVKPTPGGGVPAGLPRLECKLTFKEGGHDAFQSKFEVMKERLAYARTLQQETGQIIPTGEDLPRYEGRALTGTALPARAVGAAVQQVAENAHAARTPISVSTSNAALAPAIDSPPPAAEAARMPEDVSGLASDAKECEALAAYAQAHADAHEQSQAALGPRNEADDDIDDAGSGVAAAAAGATASGTGTGTTVDALLQLPPTPDEPPPDYEEAQAQAAGIQLEERERERAASGWN